MQHRLFISAFLAGILTLSKPVQVCAQGYTMKADLSEAFHHPPAMAAPWVFWYWNQAAVSKEGITADLKAMKEAGLGGAYLMPIKGPANPPYRQPPVVQLTPLWWDMVRYSFEEARKNNLKLGFHVSDGFALAGGPWITPALSMQKLVWTSIHVNAPQQKEILLPIPETKEGFYKDIRIVAFPSLPGTGISTRTIRPKISGSKSDSVLQLLIDPSNKKNFTSEDPCWIQYEFEQPFTCRSILIRSRNNYQSNRLTIQYSQDGKNFHTLKQLVPPRHGWQDWDEDYTHALPATTARYFRFLYNREGSEPGAEDLDAAKWKQSLKLYGLELSGEARIHQYEGKNGSVWRISEATQDSIITEASCIPSSEILDLTSRLLPGGKLDWKPPAGNWTILRLGHTSTGHRNETAGGGKGLECDKFNTDAVTLQFNEWFGALYKNIPAPLVNHVLQYLHVDSWECGSQNWSSEFAKLFREKRGYDLLPYLPVMAGYPIDAIGKSEKILHDVRQTIAELVDEKFYGTLRKLAHGKGVQLSAESVAPTMVSDGMLHYRTADIPMGEFWLRSPTHDKPNDMLDAISGAHVYGKPIVQAEGFTELRMAWDEHPGMLKTLLDHQYALGLNRLFFHVFMHNPWMDRQPGMTLDPIGLYFQRDQTWWKYSRFFVDYIKRCQALLQLGKPVTDLAVFTGEEIPRRSVLPDRLVNVLPGLMGKERVAAETRRLQNKGTPVKQQPAGVTHSANMTTPQQWTDPLNGYAYDSFHPDALHKSRVIQGKIVLPGGAAYSMLVLPGATRMSPEAGMLSDSTVRKLRQLIRQGATVLLQNDSALIKKIRGGVQLRSFEAGYERMQKGRIIYSNRIQHSLHSFGISPDLVATLGNGAKAEGISWCHRAGQDFDLYFISNQEDSNRTVNLSLRKTGMIPEIWDPVQGTHAEAREWRMEQERTLLPVRLESNASVFIVFRKTTALKKSTGSNWKTFSMVQAIQAPWTVEFDTLRRGPARQVWQQLYDWRAHSDSAVRYYAGTARYTTHFTWLLKIEKQQVWLRLDGLYHVGEVFVNGVSCGVLWTAPYRVNITAALNKGDNKLEIDVTNSWANRLIGDAVLPPEKRFTKTAYPFVMKGKPLQPSGLTGPVVLEVVHERQVSGER